MVDILVNQCNSKERLNRLTAITWSAEFINLGGDSLLPFYSSLLGAVSHCIGDTEVEIRQVADKVRALSRSEATMLYGQRRLCRHISSRRLQ